MPLTGLVLDHFCDAHDVSAAENQDATLEFAYVTPAMVSKGQDQWDWACVERMLKVMTERGRQAVLRLTDMKEPGKLALPGWLRKKGVETEEKGGWEYPLWDGGGDGTVGGPYSYEFFLHSFLKAAGEQLDEDPRVAFVQFGVGHWGEGHVFVGADELRVGTYFPNPCQYKHLIEVLRSSFKSARVQMGISVACAHYWRKDEQRRAEALEERGGTAGAAIGSFEDTFMGTVEEQKYNAGLLQILDEVPAEPPAGARWHIAPRGGEISYSKGCQEGALVEVASDINLVAERHMTFALAKGMWNPKKDAVTRRMVSASFGYRFQVKLKGGHVHVTNVGVAPIYYPTHVEVGGVHLKGENDLCGLLPGGSKTFKVAGLTGVLTLRCVRAANPIPYNASA